MWFDALGPINADYEEMKDVIKSNSRIVDEISVRFEVFFNNFGVRTKYLEKFHFKRPSS